MVRDLLRSRFDLWSHHLNNNGERLIMFECEHMNAPGECSICKLIDRNQKELGFLEWADRVIRAAKPYDRIEVRFTAADVRGIIRDARERIEAAKETLELLRDQAIWEVKNGSVKTASRVFISQSEHMQGIKDGFRVLSEIASDGIKCLEKKKGSN